jgi:hypothetical protein
MSNLLLEYHDDQLHPLISTTPRPSVVFSTTSSVESCVDGDGDDDGDDDDDDSNYGHCVQDDDCGIRLEDHYEWIEIEIEAEHVDENEKEAGYYCEHEREHEREESSPQRATSPAPAGEMAGYFEAKPKVYYYHFWKTRIAELFLIQIVLFYSIALYIQNTNRLSLTSATIVAAGSETTTLLPWRNVVTATATTATTTGMDNNNTSMARNDHETGTEDCIYVPGGGFSGFWFSLGRLQSLEDPHNETYVCYSAGCLGVVATLLHHGEVLKKNGTSATTTTNDNNNHYLHVYEMARSIQIEWQSGKRHRYRVVESFIDGLLEKLEEDPDDESRAFFLDTIRSKLNIVTTAFEEEEVTEQQDDKISINVNDNVSVLPSRPEQLMLLPQSIVPRAFVRRPSDIPSLKRLLLQSAWIPLATGSSWTHKGHMDGSFSMAQHPRCSRSVGLTKASSTATPATATKTSTTEKPSSWHESLRNQVLLWANTLNMEISQEDVDVLWRVGMEQGV